MFKKLRSILLYGGTIEENVKARIMEDNRKFAVVWSLVHVLYWGACLIMSTRDPAFYSCRGIYIAALVICCITLPLSAFAARRIPWLIRPIATALNATFLGAGLGIALILAPKTSTIFAAILLIPVSFISDIFSTVILLILDIVIFYIFGAQFLEPDIYHWYLMDMVIFASLGTIVGYFVNKSRFERYMFAESAVRLADSNAKLAEMQTKFAYYDQMTGLKNRRAYSELEERFSEEMPPHCCMILVDINGLKQMNDTLGHAAGDELIVRMADCLRRSFEGGDEIYRLGGDEFGVVLTDRSIDAEQCLQKTVRSCSEVRGKYIDGVSFSYGMACSHEFADYQSLQRAADQRMYAFKREYYNTRRCPPPLNEAKAAGSISDFQW